MVNFGYIKVEWRTVSNRVATSAGNSSPERTGTKVLLPASQLTNQRDPFLKRAPPADDSTERKFHSQRKRFSPRVPVFPFITSRKEPLPLRISFRNGRFIFYIPTPPISFGISFRNIYTVLSRASRENKDERSAADYNTPPSSLNG